MILKFWETLKKLRQPPRRRPEFDLFCGSFLNRNDYQDVEKKKINFGFDK